MLRRWPVLLGLLLGLAALQVGLDAGRDSAESWQLATRWTARAGFPLLILTYSASSLVRLKPNGLTKALLLNRRWWGLGFAACHTLHLLALVSFLRVTGKAVPPVVLAGGGLGYALLYAMALTSSPAGIRALGANWKKLHRFGIHYLWLIFTFNYLSKTRSPDEQAIGYAFSALALGALGLRIMAWRKTKAARSAPSCGGCCS